MRQVSTEFDIININHYLEQFLTEDCYSKDAEEMVDNFIDCLNYSGYSTISKKYCPFEYDYETEIGFLSGQERKKCISHFLKYLEEYQEDFDRNNYRSFWQIANTYALYYVKNNYYEWYENMDKTDLSDNDE